MSDYLPIITALIAAGAVVAAAMYSAHKTQERERKEALRVLYADFLEAVNTVHGILVESRKNDGNIDALGGQVELTQSLRGMLNTYLQIEIQAPENTIGFAFGLANVMNSTRWTDYHQPAATIFVRSARVDIALTRRERKAASRRLDDYVQRPEAQAYFTSPV